ncbi:MAG: hypothetical protein GC180_12670 [Bacteroidetes bacterium]|nr:hypothetical protein [Bacteroidota bacterium]
MKLLTLTLTCFLCFTWISCQSRLNLQEVIELNEPFSLSVRSVDPETGLSTMKSEKIEVNTLKWNKLVVFVKNNLDAWQESPASYIGDINVTQKDFRLIYSKGSTGVVIAFTDATG